MLKPKYFRVGDSKTADLRSLIKSVELEIVTKIDK